MLNIDLNDKIRAKEGPGKTKAPQDAPSKPQDARIVPEAPKTSRNPNGRPAGSESLDKRALKTLLHFPFHTYGVSNDLDVRLELADAIIKHMRNADIF